MKEHFFIVGAQRSGTTYLYEVLEQHPEICMTKPVRPEPKYFIKQNNKEITYDEYIEKYFSNSKDTKYKIYGEKSTSYYELEDSAKLISSMLPNAKIIFFLRDPVKRALSNYFFSSNNGLEKRSLEEVFFNQNEVLQTKPDDISVNPFDYIGRGKYSDFIEIYKKYFKSSQIKIIIFEEFVNNIKAIKDLYNFLEVDNEYTPSNINKVVNSSEKKFEISNEILEVIKNNYKDSNQNLEKIIKRKISLWQ